MADTKPMTDKQRLSLRKQAWQTMPKAVEARVATAYYLPPPADDVIFNPQTDSEKSLFKNTPTHAELTQQVAKARHELIEEGLLTAEDLASLQAPAAAKLAVKRWKQKHPTWPELPD